MFEQFILSEDHLKTYDKFWIVWGLFFEKMVDLCEGGEGYAYVDRMIKSYLFAQTHWKEDASSWYTFKERDSRFFADVVKKMGHCPSTLYALSKSLNNVADCYLNLGVSWLCYMLQKNEDLLVDDIDENTLYYTENLVRKYIYNERDKVRKTKQLKDEVLVVLNFLVENGSVVGYMLRESVL